MKAAISGMTLGVLALLVMVWILKERRPLAATTQ